jgi:hypothetical protein
MSSIQAMRFATDDADGLLGPQLQAARQDPGQGARDRHEAPEFIVETETKLADRFRDRADQVRLPLTLLNVAPRLVPVTLMEAMTATPIRDAISPYSIAVAPDWQTRKLRITNFISDP